MAKVGNELQYELQSLRNENKRLKALLNQHHIAWEEKVEAKQQSTAFVNLPASELSIKDKITLFRCLFRGRDDVYPQRWESAKGKSGYSPVCGNEWKPGLCHKPRVKCGECSKRLLLPVTDDVVFNHLSGKQTIGTYPLLIDDHCYFLAVDFDKQEWREDAGAFMQSCWELDIPASLEISRSGNGAHIWIFFTAPVPAREARLLGAALISHTCERTRQLSLASYDRLFPNQDTMPKGGFGNLIALPLQKLPREHGCSVFVDNQFEPYSDQWSFLASIQPMTRPELDKAILHSSGGRHPLDVAFDLDVEGDDKKPWQRSSSSSCAISCDLPESLTLVLANQVFIAKADLPQPLSNRLIRLAAFQNPDFYKAQAMRMPVWNKPRIIGCAENFSQYIGLPRGCLDDVQSLLEKNSITPDIQDERVSGGKITAKFMGKLRKDQKAAVRALFKHEAGVLSAPTAFGKTVIAAAMIARRKVSTLVLVHRAELLRQWQERLTGFLDLPEGGLGMIGGGKKKLSGKVDIAVMQSLIRMENLSELLDEYGQIIVDECHHISAFSFETVLKQSKARYVLGLTATPIRRDGHQPIIHMQCGPVRHAAAKSEVAPTQLEVWPQYLPAPEIPLDSPIQTTFRILTTDEKRNRKVSEDILSAYREGRKILVLTERTDHLVLLREGLGDAVEHCFVLHGRLSKKQRASIFAELKSLEASTPHVLLATGRLIGEGFDHPPLDTLVLAMPISWKGTLQQYAGRLHRDHADKRDVRIYDYVESDHPQLSRMWDKRQRGYHAMGYKIIQPETKGSLL
ncbi:MAG: DEAD/DEAH box helicase [Zetaproteobacteria bacterium CG12_big_fil_rev_8_21_14_0_65_54_13]|nr:MAG: DEAD/DEAH box helicase [Zetaproteobacteria bacterium CG12_big_fil_rev_8_21_14_0_65_54_13]PIX53489.1 MAG: DEAD/DEAH box helicase [Zetaproteobacteria bacterium CG_4_10_14_3_um_filter_54_28]PJA27669.1 MAG: DEAD/DEAH box helicase [Zetaproteobacteria bacterium CG_4_9_14_3_um_filter_54_145]